MRAYRRNDDGTLEIISLPILDGEICDHSGYPLTRTEATVKLQGWPDGLCRVYRTDGYVEVYVPEDRHA